MIAKVGVVPQAPNDGGLSSAVADGAYTTGPGGGTNVFDFFFGLRLMDEIGIGIAIFKWRKALGRQGFGYGARETFSYRMEIDAVE